MLDNIEYEQQKAKEDVLCGKSEKIDMDMPSQEMSLTFNYAECEKVARQKASPVPVNSASLISRYLTVNTSSIALIKQKKAIQRELALFEKENADLAKDERFSDTYYFRLAGFYSLIKNYEKEHNINYKREFSFSELKDKLPLRFDFAIFDTKGKLIKLIEFQGEQHTQPSNGFYSQTLIEHDKMKVEYCKENKIPLLHLYYKKNYSIKWEDLELYNGVE